MTLTLSQAAAYLHLHKETVRERTIAGIIKGCKPGKCWVFRVVDLDAYLVSLQKPRGVLCRSIASAVSGTVTSLSVEYPDLGSRLEQMLKPTRRSTTTKGKQRSGDKLDSARVLQFPQTGTPPSTSGSMTGNGTRKTSTGSDG